MNATASEQPPRDLLRVLFDSDRATNGSPALPDGGREEALSWLRRAFVDFEALEQHLLFLRELYDAPFSFPRPRRDCWTAEQLQAPTEPTKFRHVSRLDDERIRAVADEGVDALSDAELAKLLLNPFALFDLFDVIDDLLPEKWQPVMHTVGKELLNRGEKAALTPKERVVPPKPSSTPVGREGDGRKSLFLRLYPMAAAAAILVLTTLFAVMAVLAYRSSDEATQLRSQIAQLQQRGAPSADPISGGPGGAIEFHVDQVPRTAHLEAIWNDNYLPDDSPERNLERIRAASGPDVKKIIDDMRKANRSDLEILAFLKLAIKPAGG